MSSPKGQTTVTYDFDQLDQADPMVFDAVHYLGGLGGYKVRMGAFSQGWHGDEWKVVLGRGGFQVVYRDTSPVIFKKPAMTVFSVKWATLLALEFQEGRSTSNLLALAAFGPLGLGARMPWVIMIAQLPPAVSIVFGIPGQMLKAQEVARHAHAHWPQSHGKVQVGAPDPPAQPGLSAVEQLTAAERLHQSGALSDVEWQRLKDRLLG